MMRDQPPLMVLNIATPYYLMLSGIELMQGRVAIDNTKILLYHECIRYRVIYSDLTK